MNYYQRHIGDYARDTGHLSLLEHGVYMILLDHHYASEAGIPDGKQYRLARARTPEEREAVDNILDEFFDLKDGVWINRRAHHEVLRFHSTMADDADQKRGAAERQAKARARRSALFDELATYGVVPDFNASMQQLRHMLDEVKSQRKSQAPSRNVTRDVTANQEPLPNTHYPTANTQEPVNLSVGEVAQDLGTEVLGEVFSARTANAPAEDLDGRVIDACKALRRLGVTSANPALPNLRAAIQAGASTDHLVAITQQQIEDGRAPNANYIARKAIGQIEDAKRPAPVRAGGAGIAQNKQEAIENRNRSVAQRWASSANEEPQEAEYAIG
ncbi:YdaU family protein [Frateuria aurantia]|uniref:DUF1376 domain-containing protein n=1 Tax=Frateuria aurantia (strain ATCC 33424 / DSM 6220 / KCTC 2777 / LMG 1558 / NBRC 3245 / NCIMB 13370) TaxID=767434 RepID=H8L2H3_FRAAD|nr:YdaU family protein [Frateuria aurantia]AFC85440.1 hypothetical protein Fraau_0976 [Frateuria aurantia DSM 6220]